MICLNIGKIHDMYKCSYFFFFYAHIFTPFSAFVFTTFIFYRSLRAWIFFFSSKFDINIINIYSEIIRVNFEWRLFNFGIANTWRCDARYVWYAKVRWTRKYLEWHEARISLRVLDKITSLFVIPVYRCARGNGTRPKEPWHALTGAKLHWRLIAWRQ